MINCSRVLFCGYTQPRQVYLVPLLNNSQYICMYAVVLYYVVVVQVSPTIGKNYDGYTQYYYEIINGHPDHKKNHLKIMEMSPSLIAHPIKVFFHSWVGKEGIAAALWLGADAL